MNYAALSGIAGSFLLSIPAAVQMFRRLKYFKFYAQYRNSTNKRTKSISNLAGRIEAFFIRKEIRWDFCESIFIVLGILLIGLSFLMEIWQS